MEPEIKGCLSIIFSWVISSLTYALAGLTIIGIMVFLMFLVSLF